MSVEVILQGGAESTRRRLRHPRRLLVLVAVVVGLLLLADRWQQQREAASLNQRIAATQESIAYADAQINGVIAYGSPQLYMASTPRGVRAYLRKLVSDAAHQGIIEVEKSQAAVAETAVLPWHQALIEMRDTSIASTEQWKSALIANAGS